MPFYGSYPRYCAACGHRNLVSPNSPYKGEVCDATCWAILDIRETRAIMGREFDEEQDREIQLKARGLKEQP